ncbi:MAG TPA: Nramp family divalent metal transporter [Candidatus Saccharimonadales bacterium]|nr:Nramp family divalent metal transporter [Candidatus Saccharimonadales bacterium]
MQIQRFVSKYRSLFIFAGPALIVSMAYMDPGNYGTDIQAGASFNYGLLWTVWMANLMAMLLQYVSGKLGIATGKDLAGLVRESLNSKFDIYLNWVGAETAAAATDLAEYLGTVIALNILFNVPLLYASLFGAADILILLTLTSRRFRALEYFFMLFVSIIAFGFLYELIVTGLDIPQIAHSFVSPTFGLSSITLIVGIIGATVMPHALYVHSTLTRDKLVDGTHQEKKQLLKLHTGESIIAFTIAGMVNAAILIVSAVTFYPKFSNVSAVDTAYRIMIPIYGPLAAIVFAVTLLCSGIASSTTGTLAGQAIMDGLLGTKINKTLRRVITRIINVFPTTIAVLLGYDPLLLLVYSQVLLSLMIALPMIPLITFTAKKEIMGELVNKRSTTFLAVLTAAVIVGLNTYLIYYLMAQFNIYVQVTVLGAYGVYHLYLVYAMLR